MGQVIRLDSDAVRSNVSKVVQTSDEQVRQYVAQNAAALAQAVETLEERDEMNASDAQHVTAIIDSAATAPPVDSSTGASMGGQAGVLGALGLQ